MVPKVLRVRVLAAGLVAACLFLGVRAEAKLPDNMFMNPGFEQGQAEWRLDKAGKTAATFTVDKAPGEETASGHVTIDAVEDWGTQFGQSMDAGAPGKTYTFAVVAKSAADPVPVRLEIERRANPYDRAALSDKVTLKKETWTEVHVTFKVEKPFPQGWFAYISCVQPKAEYRIRLARLYEGEYVPYDKVAKEEVQAAGAALFDTGAASSAALSGEAVAKKAGWAQVPENQAARTFKGDAVLRNDRLAIVLRHGGPGAEVYALGATEPVARAVLAPAAGDAAPRLESVAVIKNSPEAVALDASFKAADGKALGVRYELAMGQP
ncbi:MAG: carbohydrate binding domain-containing protein, partial [Planctomycetota bacterium]|nr:carbohydrate binding domain-containing protein [Planctomycetota bacterium]